MVSSYLDATTSNAGSDKVTASKSSENPLCNTFNHTAWHNVDPPDVTKEESSRAGEKQKEESGGGGTRCKMTELCRRNGSKEGGERRKMISNEKEGERMGRKRSAASPDPH